MSIPERIWNSRIKIYNFIKRHFKQEPIASTFLSIFFVIILFFSTGFTFLPNTMVAIENHYLDSIPEWIEARCADKDKRSEKLCSKFEEIGKTSSSFSVGLNEKVKNLAFLQSYIKNDNKEFEAITKKFKNLPKSVASQKFVRDQILCSLYHMSKNIFKADVDLETDLVSAIKKQLELKKMNLKTCSFYKA